MEPSPSLSAASQRPADRVRQYLDQQLAQRTPGREMRLPAARELAIQLQVSPRTVLTVYRQYASRRLTRTQAGGGTFLAPLSTTAIKREPIRLGLSALPVLADVRRSWGGLVCAGVVEGAATSQPPCAVIPLVTTAADTSMEQMTDILIARRNQVDGLVLFPSHLRDRELIDAYTQSGKPLVYLNAPSEMATKNFASPDFHGVSRTIAQSLIHAGRRSFLVLLAGSRTPPASPEQHWSRNYGVSSQQRVNGMTAGIGPRLGQDVNLHVRVASNSHEDGASEALDAFLNQGGQVDAVYCAGDYLAFGAIQCLEKRGLRVPEDVSVIGGTGMDLSQTAHPMLTRIAQPLRETGRTLAAMLRQLILEPHVPQPGVYLPTPMIGGATTRPEENKLLRIGQAMQAASP